GWRFVENPLIILPNFVLEVFHTGADVPDHLAVASPLKVRVEGRKPRVAVVNVYHQMVLLRHLHGNAHIHQLACEGIMQVAKDRKLVSSHLTTSFKADEISENCR